MHDSGADAGSAVAGVLFDMGGTVVLDRFDVENLEAILEHMTPRADAAATLRALGDRGIYRAIVSNADDAWVQPALERHGLLDLFEHWTSSEEAASCKPDRGIFDLALAKAGLDRSAVLFVGDSVAHDIVGAHAAGMRAALISDDDGPAPLSAGLTDDAEPDHRIESLGELVRIVDDLTGRR